jgi:hypothetical protein
MKWFLCLLIAVALGVGLIPHRPSAASGREEPSLEVYMCQSPSEPV